jgi:hypothetical protein
MESYGWKLAQSTPNRTVGILTTKDLERNKLQLGIHCHCLIQAIKGDHGERVV